MGTSRRFLAGGRRLRLAALLLLLSACAGGSAPSLVEVPQPDLAWTSPVVTSQLQERREALDRLRRGEGGSGARLGQAYGEMGRLYHAYRLDDPAAACYRNASQLEPQEFRWHYYLGQLSLQAGETDAALSLLGRAVELRPRDLPARVALGRLNLTLDRREPAREQLGAALALDPHHAVAHFLLAQLAVDRQEFAEAVRHFETALAEQPEATGIHYPLALAYRALGDGERAAFHLERRGDVPLGMSDPLMMELRDLGVGAETHLEEGAVAFRNRDFAQAAAAFRRAVESDPTHSAAHQNLAAALVKLGDAAGAEERFREALRIDPDSFEAHYNLGLLLEHGRRHDGAAAAFGEAVRVDPRHADARLHLAHARRRSGACAAALTEYATLLGNDPVSPAAAIGAARCHVDAGQPAAALDLLEAARLRAPEDDGLAGALARLLATADGAEMRDGQRAVEIAERLLARTRSLENVETAAMAHAAAGRYERAAELQQAALDAATGAGREDLAAPLRANLAAYRNRRPAPEPWISDD